MPFNFIRVHYPPRLGNGYLVHDAIFQGMKLVHNARGHAWRLALGRGKVLNYLVVLHPHPQLDAAPGDVEDVRFRVVAVRRRKTALLNLQDAKLYASIAVDTDPSAPDRRLRH